MEKKQIQEPIDVRKARILVSVLILVGVVFVTGLLMMKPRSFRMEEATGDFGTERILIDEEIGYLYDNGEILLCSAADLVPNGSCGEYVIVDEDGDEKAVVTEWCRTSWIIVWRDESRGYLYAIYTDCDFDDSNDKIYYRELDKEGNKTKWIECESFDYINHERRFKETT